METLDHPGWLWGLSLIVLTMAIHATAIVMLAYVAVRIQVWLETRGLKVWGLIAILICVIGMVGLLVLHGIECGIWAAAYLRLGALNSPMDALFFSLELNEHTRRIRVDAATTLVGDGRAGGSRRNATVRCEHRVPFFSDAGVLVNAHRARGEAVAHNGQGQRARHAAPSDLLAMVLGWLDPDQAHPRAVSYLASRARPPDRPWDRVGMGACRNGNGPS